MIKGFILRLLYVRKFEKSGQGFSEVLCHFFQVHLCHQSGTSIFRENNVFAGSDVPRLAFPGCCINSVFVGLQPTELD